MTHTVIPTDALRETLLSWLGEGVAAHPGVEHRVAAFETARGWRGAARALRALAALRPVRTTIVTKRAGRLAELLDDPRITLCLVEAAGEFQLLRREDGNWRMQNGERDALVASANGVVVAAREAAGAHRHFAGRFSEIALAGLLINGCGLLLPLFSSLVYNKVVTSGHLATLWALVIGMLLFAGIEVTLRSARAFTIEQLAVHADIAAERSLAVRLFAGEAHRAPALGALLSRYRDHGAARDALLGGAMAAAVDLPFVILYLLAILVIAGPLMLVPVLAGLLMLTAHRIFHARARLAEADSARRGLERFTLLGELAGASDVWKASPLRRPLEARWEQAVMAGALGRARARFWRTTAQTGTALGATLSSVFVLAIGVHLIEARWLNVGGLIACSLLSLRAMGLMASVVGLLAGWHQFREAQAALEHVLPSLPARSAVPLHAACGEIVVRRLCWSYGDRRRLFDALDLVVQPGEKIALVGATGSGKSTLLRCLGGLLHPLSGEVLVDGIAIDAIDPGDRSRWLAYKRQEPAIFAGTLFENLGGDAVDRDRLRKVAAAVGLGLDGPSGVLSLDRTLASGGTDLSGGQRQLVELTRLLARNAQILLIDEPTAGLDADAERRVVQALDIFAAGSTLVMATHSARLIGFVDRVLVLDAGKIVQDIPAHRLSAVANDSAPVPQAGSRS